MTDLADALRALAPWHPMTPAWAAVYLLVAIVVAWGVRCTLTDW